MTTAIVTPRTKKRVLSKFEQILNKDRLLIELDRIMLCDEFEDDRKHDEIMGEMPDLAEFERQRKKGKALKNDKMPPEIVVLYNNPVLTREQEHHLFRKYNFLKYKAHKLLTAGKNTLGVQMQVRLLLEQAVTLKQRLADCNIRLAVNVSRKHAVATAQLHRLWDIVSEANWCILKSIMCFDFTRQVKFSTYTTWGIRNNLGRATAEYREHSSRFSSGHKPQVFEQPCPEDEHIDENDRQAFLRYTVDTMLDMLGERDSAIVRLCVLDSEPQTLDKVGRKFGITKERVRQIKMRSINQMREMVETGKVSLNGFLQEFVHDD